MRGRIRWICRRRKTRRCFRERARADARQDRRLDGGGDVRRPGTQGDGRFLIDKNPAKMLTAGVVTGAGVSGPHASAAFSGSAFPVSVFFQTAQSMPSQANNIAPGTVTVAIATSGVTAGFATNTAAAPQTSGVACVSDADQWSERAKL